MSLTKRQPEYEKKFHIDCDACHCYKCGIHIWCEHKAGEDHESGTCKSHE